MRRPRRVDACVLRRQRAPVLAWFAIEFVLCPMSIRHYSNLLRHSASKHEDWGDQLRNERGVARFVVMSTVMNVTNASSWLAPPGQLREEGVNVACRRRTIQ